MVEIDFELEKQMNLLLYGVCYIEKKSDGTKRIIQPTTIEIHHKIQNPEVWGISHLKNAKEIIQDFYDAQNKWTSGVPDPKSDLTKMFKESLPIFRECLIKGFDPEGKVWTEEERKEILEAPIPHNEETFEPFKIYLSKEEIDWLKGKEDESDG